MGIFLIRRNGYFYIVEKEKGRLLNKFTTGIEVPANSDRIPREAEEAKTKYIRERAEYFKNKKNVLCSTFKAEYLAVNKPPKTTKKTYGSIETAFNEFIRVAGDKYLFEYTAKDIDIFLGAKIEAVSLHTAHRIRRTLRPAFQLAIRWEYISVNPWIGSMKISLPEPDPKFMLKEEFERMLLFCDNEVLADALTWIYYTGVREAEFIKTRPSDVRVRQRLIDILSTKDNPNKDKDTRSIEMHSRLIPIYQKYMHQEFLFINPNSGKKYSARAILDGITRACKKAGLEHYTIQNLRSSYGMRLLDQDVPIKWISGQMGHSNSKVTEKHYIKRLAGEYKGVIDKVE